MSVITLLFNALFTSSLNKKLHVIYQGLCSIRESIRDEKCREALDMGCKALLNAPIHYEIESFSGLWDIIYDHVIIRNSYKGLRTVLNEDQDEVILERLYEIYDFAYDLGFVGS